MTHGWALIGIAVAAGATTKLLELARERKPYEARRLMSNVEQETYRRLRAALPEHLVFPQVQLCRFIERKKGLRKKWHNRIAQLSADFVICKADSTVTAVIEIDDRSHERDVQRWRDQKKNKACKSAGIRIIRWQARHLPSTRQMREQVTQRTESDELQSAESEQ